MLLATVQTKQISSRKVAGTDGHFSEPDVALVTEKEQSWHMRESCREEQRMLSMEAQWTELDESTRLMNFSFLLVIYIFVTIQLLNVCLVLFLTLLYIRTQR